MEKIIVLYVTCKDLSEARHIGKAMVEERLAACVNILPAMESLYHWEGKIESAQEVVLLVKTGQSLAAATIERIKKLHSYTVPCALSIAIDGGNGDYIKWLLNETRLNK